MNKQPVPTVFYKSFLEFDGANMVSILSFDGRSMEKLLSDEFSKFFNDEFPIFYKNKIQKGKITDGKYYYQNAIQNALKNNQVGACQIIIEYVVKYQNNYSSSYLFTKILPTLQEKGIEISNLLKS